MECRKFPALTAGYRRTVCCRAGKAAGVSHPARIGSIAGKTVCIPSPPVLRAKTDGLWYDTGRMNHLGNCKLLFDQGRPVGGAGREHGIIEVKSRMVQHRVQSAGPLGT